MVDHDDKGRASPERVGFGAASASDRGRLRTRLWQLWLLGVHACLLAVVVHRIWPLSTPGDPIRSDYYEDRVVYHLRGDGAVPADSWLMFGDSLIDGLPVAALNVNAVNYGIGGDDTRGLSERLPRYSSIYRAGAIVIGIGINDLIRDDVPGTVERYDRLLGELPAGPDVVCLGVLPVDTRVDSVHEGRSIARIDQLNAALETLCRSRGLHWVPPPADFHGPGGNLPAQFHTGDGVHLGSVGYTYWTRYLSAQFDRLQ